VLETLPTDHWRPSTRGECPTERPCPYVGCRHHLYLEVSESGELKLAHPGREPHELAESCALDVAARGGASLAEVGQCFGLTRERIRQIEAKALTKARAELRRLGVRAEQVIPDLEQWRDEDEERPPATPTRPAPGAAGSGSSAGSPPCCGSDGGTRRELCWPGGEEVRMDMHENPADFGQVAARLRSAARVLSPGAAPLARWLRSQASELEASTATLAKALDDYRQIPADGDEWLRRGLIAVRSYRVDQATEAVLEIADEFEELARALLADSDAATARACCAVADLVDEALVKAVADHRGMSLLPSKLDPRVKRWQRVTTVNASDEQGGAAQKVRRVALVEDWRRRNRPGLYELDGELDGHVRRALPGIALDVRHEHGVGIYQDNSEPTSRTVYRDEHGRVFSKALPACAAVGLRYAQNEAFLSHVFPEKSERAEKKTGRAQDEARRFAESRGVEGAEPVPTFSVYYDVHPEKVLGQIERYGAAHRLPAFTCLLSDDGQIEINFLLLDVRENPRIKKLLKTIESKYPLAEAGFGWSISLATGHDEGDDLAKQNHRATLARGGYSSQEIEAIERGHR
jgi:hypothetical protein